VQKFDVLGSLGNSFKLDICDADTVALVAPTDVAVDDGGNVYVVDTGNKRVLRFDPDGRRCAQRVDIEHNSFDQPLTGPVAAASGDFDATNYVYVVDAAVNQVVVYRRR
jgi:DNA-binding beta-propeller fold protein YncE